MSAASGHSQAIDMRGAASSASATSSGGGVACSFGSFYGGQLANGSDSGSSAVPSPQLFNNKEPCGVGAAAQVAAGPGCSFVVGSNGNLWRSGTCHLWGPQERRSAGALGTARDGGHSSSGCKREESGDDEDKADDDDDDDDDEALRFSRVRVPDDECEDVSGRTRSSSRSLFLAGGGGGGGGGYGAVQAAPTSVAVRSVSVGRSHCLIVSRDGRLYAFGNGGCGRLGVGDTLPRHRPVRVFLEADDEHSPAPSSSSSSSSSSSAFVEMAAAGFSHSLALTEGGLVFAFGKNTQGQCGLGWRGPTALADKLWPQRVTQCSFAQGPFEPPPLPVWTVPAWLPGPQRRLLDENQRRFRVVYVGCGYQHSLLLTAGGAALTFGDSALGRCKVTPIYRTPEYDAS